MIKWRFTNVCRHPTPYNHSHGLSSRPNPCEERRLLGHCWFSPGREGLGSLLLLSPLVSTLQAIHTYAQGLLWGDVVLVFCIQSGTRWCCRRWKAWRSSSYPQTDHQRTWPLTWRSLMVTGWLSPTTLLWLMILNKNMVTWSFNISPFEFIFLWSSDSETFSDTGSLWLLSWLIA